MASPQVKSEFSGFPPLVSNFTPTPNVFFDYVLPNFPPCVVSVVGAIIRATLGWQDPITGEKRVECELSIPDIARLAKIAENSVRKGVRAALEAGLLVETARAGQTTGARYALRWENQEQQQQAIERSRKSTGDYPPSTFEGGASSEGVQNLTPSNSAPHIKKRSPGKKTAGLSSEKKSLDVGEGQEGEPPAPRHPDSQAERPTSETEIYKREIQMPVEELIAWTKDEKSRGRWTQLRRIAVENSATGAWDDAIRKTRERMASAGVVNVAAYLHVAMLREFDNRGVTVPAGTEEERDEVRGAIGASLGLGG